jgi:hypothetical protein
MDFYQNEQAVPSILLPAAATRGLAIAGRSPANRRLHAMHEWRRTNLASYRLGRRVGEDGRAGGYSCLDRGSRAATAGAGFNG